MSYGIPARDLACVHEICRAAGESGRIPVIIAGTHPDFDSAGAALGMGLFLSNFFEQRPFMVSGPTEPRLTAAGFRSTEPEFFASIRRQEGDQNLFYVLVDAPSTEDGWGWPASYGPPPIPDLVIDHHTGDTNGRNSLISCAARATSILTLALLETRAPDSLKNAQFITTIAPLMLAGVMIDNGISTDDGLIVFPQETPPVVIEAVHTLNRCSLNLIPIDDLHNTHPIFRHMLRNALLSRLQATDSTCAVACVGALSEPTSQLPMAARIAKEMRQHDGMSTTVVLAFFEQDRQTFARLLVRTEPAISASDVVHQLIGEGGGNGQQAGGELPLTQLLERYGLSDLPESALRPDIDNRYIDLEKRLLPPLLERLSSILTRTRSSLPNVS